MMKIDITMCGLRLLHKFAAIFSLALTLVIVASSSHAQEITPGLLDAMRWRLIGPFRAGRVTSVCGIPTQPNVYYIGTPGGGVWKSEEAGRVWKPIFDSQRVASIGAVVVSPSNPNVVYVGTGEQTQGDGVYKSTDAGATWSNVGLPETHIIPAMIVDPRNPDVVLVGALGDRTSGVERGVYKTVDGGKNWQKVLFKDTETGVVDLQADPSNPSIVYAALWRRPVDPFAPPEEEKKEQDAAIYKSTDEGSTWTPVEGKGLPTDPMSRLGLAVAPGTNGMRVYADAKQGLYRSEDGGATWQKSTTDPRIFSSGYITGVTIDPKNADILYVEQTSLYRSADGGRTFEAWQGAPSGDDYHVLWINPLNPQYIIAGVDQGAVISVNGGATWSSWYNQPTGQFYHVSTDNQFPYRVFGAQQDSGTAGVPSRSDFGQISYRDWAPIGGFEFAYIAADPLNQNYIYTGGWYGSVLRYDKTTKQITHLFVRTPKYRTANMVPIYFSPQDPHALYIGAQYVLTSRDGGVTWKEISPDLTQPTEAAKKTGEEKRKKVDARLAVINTMSLSPVKAGVIWAGTGNGMIQVTKDGKSWSNVTIPGLPERATMVIVEASRHDAATAYAVVQVRLDLRPFIYRTRDFGQHWEAITTGLSGTGTARVVREDPVRKGMLFAGTTNGAYVSFDDGDHWQSLQLNLPISPVTDIDVHGNDLAISTFGRALWILDDISPLRQFDAKLLQTDVTLLTPSPAVRTRWDMDQDTPLPPGTPVGQNPPDGAIVNYFLKSPASGDIKLSIYDSQNNPVREFSTVPAPYDPAPPNAPEYWFAPQPVLSTHGGLNRFVWDLHYPPPKTLRYGYFNERLAYFEYTLSEHAVPGEFPRDQPVGAYIVPGQYSVVLQVGGKEYRQPLSITLHPRVHASQADLEQQLATQKNISAQMAASYDGDKQIVALRDAISERQKSVGTNSAMKDVADALKSLDDQVAEIDDGKPTEFGMGPINRELARLASMVESGDARPAAPLQDAVEQSCQTLTKRVGEWREVNEKKISPVNELLKKNSLAALPVAGQITSAPSCGTPKGR